MSPHKIEPTVSPKSLSSFGISENGFLPAEPPLEVLPQEYYQPWESVIRDVTALVQTQQIRKRIDELPVLKTSLLESEPEWQRAYLILTILAQGYIWQGPEPSQRLPPSITVPLIQTAEHLEVNPVATYAALNLWNYRVIGNDADLTNPDNLVALHTISGTDDESWFLMISNAMEARAGPLIHAMLDAMQGAEFEDAPTVIQCLQYFKESMDAISRLLARMDERCNPQIFYHTIRPFLAGSMNMESAGLPNGVFYDEGDGKGSWRKYRGGSNGQSSLLQFFDAVLSVNHSRCGGFHEEMRRYMPGPHARFLDLIESKANIRAYVDAHQEDLALVAAFNEAIAALGEFRNTHIALVTRYIVIPSRMARPANASTRTDLASASTQTTSETGKVQELVGTGGTKLIPFLRTSRDETMETAVTP